MGFDSERLRHKGRLAEKEADARRLAMSISGLVDSVRVLLDPFEDLEDIKAEHAAAQAVELAGKHAEYCGLLEEIKAIKKALGI
ncbi:MAG: hypothetical protein ACYC0F_18180 [Rhodanobacter sp.]